MDYHEIANRIAQVILSPNAVIGFTHGVISVPVDFGYLAYSYLDTGNRYSNQTESIRLTKAIRYGILENHNLTKSIKIIIDLFNGYIPINTQNTMYSKSVSSLAGRMITSATISSKITTAILQTTQYSRLIKLRSGVISSILLMGGMATRSIYKSKELSNKDNIVYSRLRYAGDLDFIYFLIQPFADPFIEAIAVRQKHGQEAFDKIISLVEDTLNGH